MTHFNATELIPLVNRRRTKKVAHFLDNRHLVYDPNDIETVKGRGAHTNLPNYLLGEFLLWLTPKTRKAVLEGIPLEEIVAKIAEFW